MFLPTLAPRAGLFALLMCAAGLDAQVAVEGKVTDENGVAVPGARIELLVDRKPAAVAVSDPAGRFALPLGSAGAYQVRAEKPGFFRFAGQSVTLSPGLNQLQVTLHHLQEFSESIEVSYSPPVIDPQEPAERKQLNNVEILEVPYPAPQDLRNSLPLLPGVVQDNSGRLHFDGGATHQTNFTLDGFNLSDPVTGQFEARINIETVRSLDLDSSRFSAEKGRGSAGALDIKTKTGDDKWRFGSTNFVPGVTTEDGLHVNKWTPRVQVSGPIRRGRAWFHNGFDLFYDVDIVHGLPQGENRTRGLTTSNLTRLHVNLTPAHIVTASLLMNYIDQDRHGLTFLDPLETTTNRRQNFWMTTLKDQIYFGRGALLEFGFSDSRGLIRHNPQGSNTFEISPAGRRGNYFLDLTRHSSRQQWLANAFLPAFAAAGSHQLKLGFDLQRSAFDQEHTRHDYRLLRADMTVARHVTFAGNRTLGRHNFEFSKYVQDRWTPFEGLLIEAGLRTDWDQIARDVLWSPRLSAAWAPGWMRETKLAAGIGVFHDALSLGLISQHLDQASYSTFFLPSGLIRSGPIETRFLVNEAELRVPRARSLSASLERKLPFGFYGKAAYLRKTGADGLTFASDGGTSYWLRNRRRDRYDALELVVRRTFAGRFEWLAGYTRSSARSDAVIDYSLESPVFAPQNHGPLPWDNPNRFITWGWAPVPKRLLPRRLGFLIGETNVAYLFEQRSGFPFSAVNEEASLVGRPNSLRLPSYFNMNLHFERRFRLLHYLWAWRFGVNNLTNNGNPNVVNNNVDSPSFLAYGRGQSRAFNVRLRFLGRR